MKHVTKRLILAFYPQAASASLALGALGRRGCTTATVIDRSSVDSIRISRNGLAASTQVYAAILSSVASLPLLAFAASPPWLTVSGAVSVFLIVLFLFRRRFLGLNSSWIDKYRTYVFSGETLLLAEVPSNEVKETLAVLREFVLPAIFVVHSARPLFAQIADAGPALMTAKQVRAFAAELGSKHAGIPTTTRRQRVLEGLAAAETDLEALSRDLVDSVGLEQPMPPAAEWLYDNFHLIRSEIAEVRRNLPKRYDRELPALADDETAVSLRIARLAEAFVRSVDSRLNSENITEMLESYQTVTALSIAELWVFPIMWRVALVEELRRLSLIVASTQRNRDLAQLWADRLRQAARHGPDAIEEILSEMARDRGDITPGLIARLSEQLHDEEGALVTVQQWFERELNASLADIIRDEHNDQARTTISIRNAVGSLRQLGHVDYQKIFERVCLVEAALHEDPSGIYVTTSFETRDLCRRSVEELARFSPTSELEVARLAIQLATEEKENPRARHVGYYLLDGGLGALEARVRCRRPLRQRLRRLVLRHATVSYLGATIGLTLILTWVAVSLTMVGGAHSRLLLAVLAMLALIPASDLAIQIINSLVVSFLPPRFLPRNSFEKGIPTDSATLVVVPMMLLTRDSIRTEIEKIEVRYLANPDEHIYFSLLSDFTDATEPEMAEDAELLSTAVKGIEELNNRYPGDRFLLFHRIRRWSKVENRWIGWERKRGKLEELNRYLAGDGSSYERFLYVGRLAEQIHFVITLDSDTQLPAGAARKMIESISHPLNRVELSADGRSRIR